jgi:hypothetical protein
MFPCLRRSKLAKFPIWHGTDDADLDPEIMETPEIEMDGLISEYSTSRRDFGDKWELFSVASAIAEHGGVTVVASRMPAELRSEFEEFLVCGVVAPTLDVYADAEGVLRVGEPFGPQGKWVPFEPRPQGGHQ